MKNNPTNRLRSSWNPDRVAGSVLNREHKERVARPVSTIKTYKTGELFTRLYGRVAYESWVAREAEIDKLMKERRRYSISDIIYLREQNYRQMKSAGAKREAVAVSSAKFAADLGVAA